MTLTSPGFFDLQVNGFAGVDFNDPATTPAEIVRASAAMRATGVTRYLPTLITTSLETFATCVRTLTAAADPAIAGIHLEGPYISAVDGPRGAHPREHVRAASFDNFQRRQDAADGRIVLVTLAPEVEGALPLIERLVAQTIRVAIGHTAASPELIREAVQCGACMSTHLGNGCALELPRHPNFIWEQLADDRLAASFIADGHHLPPATFKAMLRAKSPARSVLVTDAMAAAGCPPGRYTLGGSVVELDATGRVAAPGARHLAGSALTMPQAVTNAVRFAGLPLAAALAMATTQPAALLGQAPEGTLQLTWNDDAGLSISG